MPDLRGLFLRGHGGNSAELGSPQGHAMRDISSAGSISVGFGGYLTGNGIFKPVGSHGVVVIRGSWDGNWGSTAYGLDLSAGGVPVANEVRPDNQAVRTREVKADAITGPVAIRAADIFSTASCPIKNTSS